MPKFAGFGARAALAVAVTFALSAPLRAEAVTAETVVASVNGTDITLGQVIALRDQLPEQYQQLADDVLYKGIVDQLIQQVTLAQSVEGKLTLRDELVLENQRLAYLAGTVLQGVVDAEVTPEAIKAAYDARIAAMPPATEYRAAHILVADEQVAKDLKAQIDGGADFAELAKANSTDGSAANGGDLGWFGVGMMVKPFEDAVVAMQPGQVAGPVQTQFGWHLIKLEETRPATPPTLEELTPEITQELQRKAVEDHVAGLSEGATITRVDGIDPALIKDQTLLGN